MSVEATRVNKAAPEEKPARKSYNKFMKSSFDDYEIEKKNNGKRAVKLRPKTAKKESVVSHKPCVFTQESQKVIKSKSKAFTEL